MAPTGNGLIAHSVRAYPARTALMVLLLFLAGAAEGIGLATLLPLLELVAGGSSPSGFTVAVGDALARVGLAPRLEVLLALIVIGMALKAAFRWAAMVQVGYTVAAVATDLRLTLVRALLQARWSYFAAQPAGHFANALSMEAYRASAAYREACAALASAIQACAYLALAFLLSWQVALVALLAGIVLLLALNGFVRMSWRAGRRQTDRMMSLVAHLVDALQGLKPLKAMAREAQLWRLLEREARAVDQAQRRQVLASETLKLLQEPLLVVMVAIGLYVLLRAGNQPFATVLVMVFLFHRIVAIVHRLQGHYQSMASGASAFWSVRGQVERTEAERETGVGTQPPPPLREGIRLDGVGFTHGATPILHDVSLFIPAGRLVALVGPSGAGKTTLADVIAGLHRPTAGTVYVDGMSMAEVDLPAWRRTIGYVPQESLLLHDTIASNVALGDAEIDDAAVEEALRAAGAWDFVAARPEGMHAIAGERGGMMSGGQAQRIALARALVRKPRLLVLDEVTSGLDAATEAAIFETLLGMRGAVTILFISHRSAVVDAADLVIRIDAGAIEVEAPARASAR